MTITPSLADLATWSLDREIVLTQVYAAPRAAVYRAWTDPNRFCRWFGPNGFVCTVASMDVSLGGLTRFTFVGPDGTLYTNRFEYIEIVQDERLVFLHGSDVDDDPSRFHVTVTFDAQDDGKTVLTLRQLHPTAGQRNAGIGFGAVELGLQTLGKLAADLLLDEA
jgi:uncharacterized protein YndB with AHSA1/START domain